MSLGLLDNCHHVVYGKGNENNSSLVFFGSPSTVLKDLTFDCLSSFSIIIFQSSHFTSQNLHNII